MAWVHFVRWAKSLPHSSQNALLLLLRDSELKRLFNWEMAKFDALFKLQYFYSPLPNKRMTVAVVDKQMDNMMESKECFGEEYENRENL